MLVELTLGDGVILPDLVDVGVCVGFAVPEAVGVALFVDVVVIVAD